MSKNDHLTLCFWQIDLENCSYLKNQSSKSYAELWLKICADVVQVLVRMFIHNKFWQSKLLKCHTIIRSREQKQHIVVQHSVVVWLEVQKHLFSQLYKLMLTLQPFKTEVISITCWKLVWSAFQNRLRKVIIKRWSWAPHTVLLLVILPYN